MQFSTVIVWINELLLIVMAPLWCLYLLKQKGNSMLMLPKPALTSALKTLLCPLRSILKKYTLSLCVSLNSEKSTETGKHFKWVRMFHSSILTSTEGTDHWEMIKLFTPLLHFLLCFHIQRRCLRQLCVYFSFMFFSFSVFRWTQDDSSWTPEIFQIFSLLS